MEELQAETPAQDPEGEVVVVGAEVVVLEVDVGLEVVVGWVLVEDGTELVELPVEEPMLLRMLSHSLSG